MTRDQATGSYENKGWVSPSKPSDVPVNHVPHIHFFSAVIKHSDKKQLNEERVYCGSQFKGIQSIMRKNSRQQEREAAGHITCTTRNRE